VVLLATALASCATLEGGEGGGEALPNAGAGPFRKLVSGELGLNRSAPYALSDDRDLLRDPAILDEDGDPATPAVVGYFAANLAKDPPDAAPPDALVRVRAVDGRSFERRGVTVLVPSLAWEGASVGAPAALRVGGATWLYYAAGGGIGLARSDDGEHFAREPEPVLGAVLDSWELGAVPASPSVVRLPDGSFRMFYEVAFGDGSTRIGEARSLDGLRFERVGEGPVLAPSAARLPSGDAAYDDAAVGSPSALVATPAVGRPILRVYYAARDRDGHQTIGLAARLLGDEGPLERAVAPVFGVGEKLQPREPCVVAGDGYSWLFVTQRAGKTKSMQYPAVAVGVAPALAELPPAAP
jgi:hypothetical protein